MKPVAYTSTFPKSKGYIETNCKVSEAYDSDIDHNGPHPDFEECTAFWDTGAMRSTISINIANKLHL